MKMKLKLIKKKMKSLSNDNKAIPAAMTPQVAGGYRYTYQGYNCTVTVEVICTDPLTNFNCASNKVAHCDVA